MGAPLPWFPFRIDAFETDEKVARLSMEERGIYIHLLCWQWREGSVPNDTKFVGQKLNVSATAVRRVFDHCFTRHHGSRRRLVNQTLNDCYVEALGKSENARRAGLISASKRAALAEQKPNGAGADVERSRSRIRSTITKSLESATSPQNPHARVEKPEGS